MNAASAPASADAAAVAGAAPADALSLDPALAAAQPGGPAQLPFLQFMQADAVMPGEQPQADGAADAAAPAAADAPEEHTEAADEPLGAAMTMPLMASMMTLPAALPAAVRLAAGMPQREERTADALAPAATGGAAPVELPSSGAARVQAAQPAPVPDAAAQQARASAAAAQPAAAPQQAAAATAAPAREAAGADGQAAGNGTPSTFGVPAPAAPAAAPREGSTLTLSGPPTAWRQSLQEALGDRLNLQIGKNAEQAVIRLEPPMLGRVEISIRHTAGSLEVNITATHSEVLRQLNTVSDNLRSDLAQRQYTDVSVNVSQAGVANSRAQAAQQGAGFGADAQGRGRQQGQDQDERAPGAALAEANQSTTAFSLNGRA